MFPVFDALNLRSADAVVECFQRGAGANLAASCRRGGCDVIGPFGPEAGGDGEGQRLIATGDLHDNPLHMARVVEAAHLADPADGRRRFHLTLHELIHGDELVNETDFSYRVLARAAALKAAFPEHVHTLLANHELSQMTGREVIKEGHRCVEAFNAGLEAAFGDEWSRVASAAGAFIRSMPLGLRVRGAITGAHGSGDLVCLHSLPAPEALPSWDETVLIRALDDSDYEARRGAAYWTVWGRGHTRAMTEELLTRVKAGAFIVGHEHADAGIALIEPATIIVNSDHARGVYLDIDLSRSHDPASLLASARSLALHA